METKQEKIERLKKEIKFEKELDEEKRWLKKWLILYRCTISGFLRLKILEKIFVIKKRIKELENKQ